MIMEFDKENIAQLSTGLDGRPHLIGREDFFNSVILVPLFQTAEGIQLLFERRSNGIRQGGEICFPGGAYDDADECSIVATALRETEEELGIPKSAVIVLGELGTVITPFGVAVDSVIGLVDFPLEKLIPNPQEVEDYFLLPLAWFLENEFVQYDLDVSVDGTATQSPFPAEKLGLPERYRGKWCCGSHRVYVYQTPKGVIWGITAKIIKELCALYTRANDINDSGAISSTC